jgi:biopolymer transport protein TolQ
MMGGTRIDMERRSRHLLRAEMRQLEVRIPALGTVGSIAPFVGLLGTVIGIVKAFQTISTNVGGGPELVAGGIAEALVTTATGLLVAIPAIVAYNYFVTRLRRMAEEMDLAVFDVVDFLATEAREES